MKINHFLLSFNKIPSKKYIKKLLSSVNFSLSLSLNDNQMIKIPIRGGIGTNHRYYCQNWIFVLLSQLLKLKEGAFLDIGVNIGQTLLSFKATQIPRQYIGFEPNPICIYYLSNLIDINHWSDCLIVPVGLSNENSLVKLYFSPNANIDSGASILKSLRPNRDLVSSIIPVFQLDDIISQLNIEQISTIKIDVEGVELKVLQGMKKVINQYRPLIICEVLFRDRAASAKHKQERDTQLLNFLKEQNYLIFQIIKTENLETINYLQAINTFSQEIRTRENKNLCDYLFVPTEAQTIIAELV